MAKTGIFQNSMFIIGGKICQSVLSLVINLFAARYLGPSNYGIISYAASLTAFLIPIMQLGFRSTLVNELVTQKEDQGLVIGTTLVFNTVSSIACIVGMNAYVMVANAGETETIIVCFLYSISLFFQALLMVEYWFQANLMSKYSSLFSLIAYGTLSAYKIIILINGKNIFWFAITNSVDYFIASVLMLIFLLKKANLKLRFSFKFGKDMLNKSKFFIISSLMVTIFSQTDKLMIEQLLDNKSVGLYSAAITVASLSSFVFLAIIDSFRPVIFGCKATDQSKYEEQLTLCFSIVFWLAILQCVVITGFSDFLIMFLYGEDYKGAEVVLRYVVWFTSFSYLGPIRNIWILAENKQHLLWLLNLGGALCNVGLNLVLIPSWGMIGAAVASIITQFTANFLMSWIILPYRRGNVLLIRGINPIYSFKTLKILISRGLKTLKK